MLQPEAPAQLEEVPRPKYRWYHKTAGLIAVISPVRDRNLPSDLAVGKRLGFGLPSLRLAPDMEQQLLPRRGQRPRTY